MFKGRGMVELIECPSLPAFRIGTPRVEGGAETVRRRGLLEELGLDWDCWRDPTVAALGPTRPPSTSFGLLPKRLTPRDLYSDDVVLLNLYVKADYGCPKNLTQSDRTRNVFLDFHNEIRRQLSTGTLRSKYRYLGPAKNMYKLKWDCALEDLAQTSDQNVHIHSRTRLMSPNNVCKHCQVRIKICFYTLSKMTIITDIISVRYRGGDVTVALDQVQRTWVNPILRYGMTGNRFYYKIESFGNMVNYKNLRVGCAYQICRSNLLVSCVYGTKRIPPMQELWEPGRTCLCTMYPQSFCSNGICDTNQPVESEIKTTTKRPRVDGPDSCNANTGMTDDLREIFLKKHNYYRLAVVVTDVYDCEVEASAMRHAEKCRWGHSNKADRFGLGENVWASLQPEMNRSLAAEM
ncbi:SCP-like protein, partial [Ostertagia ostertagi]